MAVEELRSLLDEGVRLASAASSTSASVIVAVGSV